MGSIQSDVVNIARKIRLSGVSKAGGNVSAFKDGIIYITPSGKDLLDINESDIVVIESNEDITEKKPSREWQIHKSVYESNKINQFIVHVHSPYATAISCCRIDIPPFHFMVAAFGGDTINCSQYATFGSKELSENTVTALGNRKACLLANHGAIITGETAEEVYSLTVELEELCKAYSISNTFGKPVLLSKKEMEESIILLSK
ncbi:MAG: class II aldolase [Desulfobacterales bacterium]|nr:class II aldolase [Desulfobacterales bacterium]MCP4163266.1 class II aldolase [Deltaproteobacteria bacterium]